jgi:hypothetical protein
MDNINIDEFINEDLEDIELGFFNYSRNRFRTPDFASPDPANDDNFETTPQPQSHASGSASRSKPLESGISSIEYQDPIMIECTIQENSLTTGKVSSTDIEHPFSDSDVFQPGKTPTIQSNDSNNDVMVIEPQSASMAARIRWRTQAKGKGRQNDGEAVFVKQEEIAEMIILDPHENIPISSTQANVAGQRRSPIDLTHRLQSTHEIMDASSQGFGESHTSLGDTDSPSTALQPVHQAETKTLTRDIASMLTRQREIISRTLNRNRSLSFVPKISNGALSLSSQNEIGNSSTAAGHKSWSLASMPIYCQVSQPPSSNLEGSNMPDFPDSATNNHNEDDSWMHEEDGCDDTLYHHQCSRRDSLERKQCNRTITNEEYMVLFKLKRDIETVEHLCRAASRTEIPNTVQDIVDDDEDTLFVPHHQGRGNETYGSGASHSNPTNMHSLASNNDLETSTKHIDHTVNDSCFDDKSGELRDTRSSEPQKQRQKRAKNAREVYQREEERREKQRNKIQKKKRKKERTALKPLISQRSRGKDKENLTSDGGRRNGKAKIKKGDRDIIKNGESLLSTGPYNHFNNNGEDPIGQMILKDLLSNDPIADRLGPVFTSAATHPEPKIHGRQNKDTQFQTLFANIPENEFATSNVKSDKKKLKEASRSFGHSQCRAQDGKWLIKGMKSTLYHHQLLGAQWMIQRELSLQPPHGGMLADSMGLGKTVQTLACMVGNPPSMLPAHFTSSWIYRKVLTHNQVRGIYHASLRLP